VRFSICLFKGQNRDQALTGVFLGFSTQTNPADVKGICQTNASAVQQSIYNMCAASDQTAAFSALSDTCKASGVTIGTYNPLQLHFHDSASRGPFIISSEMMFSTSTFNYPRM
jgi:hypothetical protein